MRRALPPLIGFGTFGLVFAVVLLLVVAETAPKEGKCFAPGSLGDRWVNGIAAFGIYGGLFARRGRRLFCLGMTTLAAGAALFCFLAGVGNAICEY